MQQVSKQFVNNTLTERSQRHHIDCRLRWEVLSQRTGESFHLLKLDDPNDFLSLIWHWNPSSGLLTPRGGRRTIRDVVMRMNERGWDFDRLASEPVISEGEHNPRWFRSCKEIADGFQYDRFHWIAINHATADERRDSPPGRFSIFDGCHKTLVLGWLLMTGRVEYTPVECLLLEPFRDGRCLL